MKFERNCAAAALSILSLCVAGALFAQASGLTRTVVGRADVSVPGREAVVARVEVAPGAHAGRHTHPGDEISYVLEGEVIFYVGSEVHRLRAGDGILIDSQLPHRAERAGKKAAHILMAVSKSGPDLLSPEWWNVSRPTLKKPSRIEVRPFEADVGSD